MTNDLVTRLRALAEEPGPQHDPYRMTECSEHVDWQDVVEPRNQALREAAEALLAVAVRMSSLEQERDALKAKLAEAETYRSESSADAIYRIAQERDELRRKVTDLMARLGRMCGDA